MIWVVYFRYIKCSRLGYDKQAKKLSDCIIANCSHSVSVLSQTLRSILTTVMCKVWLLELSLPDCRLDNSELHNCTLSKSCTPSSIIQCKGNKIVLCNFYYVVVCRFKVEWAYWSCSFYFQQFFYVCMICLYDMFMRCVYMISLYDMFVWYVYTICLYDMFIQYVYMICIYDMFIWFVYTICLYDMFMRYVYTICLYDMFIRYVYMICLYDVANWDE